MGVGFDSHRVGHPTGVGSALPCHPALKPVAKPRGTTISRGGGPTRPTAGKPGQAGPLPGYDE